MSKHTPGPWQLTGARWTVLGGPNGHRRGICVLSNTHDVEQADANRRLIAAAPDLLAACQAIVGQSESTPVKGVYEVSEAGLDRARAAIAKAEGKDGGQCS